MKNHNLRKTNTEAQELDFKTIYQIIGKYKWSIIFITLLSAMLSYVYLYFQPSIYNSYAIIKVKPNASTESDDLINSTISTSNQKEVIEEISLLNTFKINKKSLNKVNFEVEYFKQEGYRQIEIYNDLPVKIQNIDIKVEDVIGKKIKITPLDTGFTLSYTNSYKEKIQHNILHTELFTMDEEKIYPYNKKIEHQYFTLTVKKNYELSHPIYFSLYGAKRNIFENIIKERLDISQLEKDTSLIKISYQDNIPQRAKLYVNALTNSFINHSIQSKNQQNDKTLDFIIEELTSIKKELKASEEKLEKHQISKNIVKPSIQAGLYIKELSSLEIEISENKLKKKLLINLIRFVKNNYKLDAIAPSIAKIDDKNTYSLVSKLQNNQLLEDELAVEYTDAYPKLQSLKKQSENIRNKIEYNLDSLRKNIDSKNLSLEQRKKGYEENLKTLPSKERELVNIKRNYEVKSKMYEYLLKKKAENKIVQLATFSDYQIIDQAYTSSLPIKPIRPVIFIVSIFLGFILAFILAFIRHLRNNKIQSKEDIEKLTSLPLYGTIPFYKQKKFKVQVHQEVKSPFTESYRTLRTNLQFLHQGTTGTTILLTSTIAGEGKSTTSANLATILEMAKYKTLVINLDLRKPTLHKFFSVTNDKGVSSYLSEKHSVEEIIKKTEFANLDIITSGPIPMDPAELILSKNLPLLLEEVKKLYDYVIIDTAPIGIVTDTKTIMKYSDLNIIIVREDYAKRDFLSTLESIMDKHNFENVGLLLNASKEKGGEYGYGYSYEYEY